MKQEYLTNLSQEFDNKGVSAETYSQIVYKYSTWYDRLLSDGKSDAEIQEILKSPSEVASIFAEKFAATENNTETVSETTSDADISVSVNVEESTESTPTSNEASEHDFTEQKANQNVINQPVSYQSPEYTPNYIVKTDRRGRQKFFEKRSFGGKLGIFFLFILASSVCLPVLFTLFSFTLTASFASMLFFFTPFYYLIFIWRFDSVSYLEHIATGSNITNRVLTLPIDKLNDVIEYLNSITSFQFPVFLQAILISIFGFAALLLCLYLCLNMFRANVAYFAWFFNKISLKRVKK